MDPDGNIEHHTSPEAILRWIKRHDARHGTGFDVTMLEWQDVPEGFKVPEAQ